MTLNKKPLQVITKNVNDKRCQQVSLRLLHVDTDDTTFAPTKKIENTATHTKNSDLQQVHVRVAVRC